MVMGSTDNLGKAEARIGLDVRAYISDARQIERASQRAGQEIEDSFEKGTRDAARASRRNLGNIREGLSSIREELFATFAGGAIVTGFGLSAADSIVVLRKRFEELTGSQESAEALMERIARNAEAIGLPVRKAQEEFLGLVPAVESAGENLDEYFDLVARTATQNPREGISGAIFAIREALSSGGTDLISLSERFELPRKELRSLIEETGSFSAALDQILDQYGATTEAAQAQARSLSGLRARYQDLARRTLEKAFLPVLDDVLVAGEDVLGVLENIPDPLAQIGGAGALAVTGISASALALSGLLDISRRVKQNLPALKAGLKSLVFNRVTVGAGAVSLGAIGGLELGRAIGRARGDEEVASQDFGDVLDTGRKLMALFIDRFIQGVEGIAIGAELLRVQIEKTPAQIDLFIGYLQQGGAQILAAIAELIAGIPGTDELRQRLQIQAVDLVMSGSRRQADALRRMDDINESLDIQGIRDQFRDARESAFRFFGFLQDGFDTAAQNNPFQVIQETAQAVFAALQKRSDELVASFDERVQFEEELLNLQDAAPDAINSRIQSLRNEQQAINQLLPNLEALAPTSEEAAEKLEQYRGRLATISSQLPRLAEALEASTADALENIASERAGEIADIRAEADASLLELERDTAQERSGLRQEERQAFDEYQDAQAKAREDYYDRLAEIDRQREQDSILARSRLDAAGLAATIQKANEERRTAEKRLTDEQQQNQQRFNEQRQSLRQELHHLATHYQEREAVILANERQEIQQISQKYNQQEQAIRSQLSRQLAAVQQAQQQELALRQQGFSEMVTSARSFAADLIQVARDLASAPTPQINPADVGMTQPIEPVMESPVSNITRQQISDSRYVDVTNNIYDAGDPERVRQLVRDEIIQIAGA